MLLLISVFLLIVSHATALNGYVPIPAWCPSGPLVRPASGLSTEEKTYRTMRKGKADIVLKAWLRKTDPAFGTGKLPTLALSSSGGGYRSLLTSAGVVQGLDARDSNVSTSGIYQSLTYHSALSGGGWMLSSMAGNNYPTITELKETIWKDAFDDSVVDPATLIRSDAYLKVLADITRKRLAGFEITVVDVYGRLLSYQLLKGYDGGVATTLSSITDFSNFKTFNVPFPIITAISVKHWEHECTPGLNGTQFEFSPYEFGSWDQAVSAFTPTKFLGTSLQAGKPTGMFCKKNYDNLGYIFGTSSNVFPAIGCAETPIIRDSQGVLLAVLISLVNKANSFAANSLFALYKNPFYKYSSPTGVRNLQNDITEQQELHLVDGGMSYQNNPIFPLLQPARGIDVIIVNDNSADSNQYPNGSAIINTYVQALAQNLTRMPWIPSIKTFLYRKLDKEPAFFGCEEKDKATIIWLPNAQFSYASNKYTAQLIYPQEQTEKMIANGVQVATQGGDVDWGTCLGCAIMKKTGEKLPDACHICFALYCITKGGFGARSQVTVGRRGGDRN